MKGDGWALLPRGGGEGYGDQGAGGGVGAKVLPETPQLTSRLHVSWSQPRYGAIGLAYLCCSSVDSSGRS